MVNDDGEVRAALVDNATILTFSLVNDVIVLMMMNDDR